MKYLALTIAINGEVPDYNEGLMRKIADYFIKKGYYFRLVHDKATRPRGFYLFETDDPQSDLSEFNEFLDGYKKEGVKYQLTELKDVSELLKPKNS